MMTWHLGWVLAVAVLAMGCGEDKPPFASQTVTVVIGSGEKADEPQDLISALESLTVGDEVVLARQACTPNGERWVLKQTVQLAREVAAGTRGTLALTGPQGAMTLPVTFSDRLIPRTAKHRVGGREVQVQCYASVGNKWGLILRVAAAP